MDKKLECDIIKTDIKPKKCEFCEDLFWNLGRHQSGCKDRKQFIDELNKIGVLERPRLLKDDIWVSGGMKVVLILRDNLTTDKYLEEQLKKKLKKDDIQLVKNLKEFEDYHNMRLEYDSEKDELGLTFPEIC